MYFFNIYRLVALFAFALALNGYTVYFILHYGNLITLNTNIDEQNLVRYPRAVLQWTDVTRSTGFLDKTSASLSLTFTNNHFLHSSAFVSSVKGYKRDIPSITLLLLKLPPTIQLSMVILDSMIYCVQLSTVASE